MKQLFILFAPIFVFLMLLAGCGDEGGGSLTIDYDSTDDSGSSTYYALTFDGSSDYMEDTSNSFAMVNSDTSVFTIAMWVKPNTSGSPMGIFSLRVNASNRFDIIMTNSRNIEVVFNDASTDAYTSTGVLTLNQNNFVAVVMNAGAMSIYINGTLAETPTGITTTYNSGSGDIFIGFDSNNSDHFSGDIHAIAYWINTALDVNNITEIYNSGSLGFDLSTNQGDYTQSGQLNNWWRLGVDNTNVGKDYGGAPLDVSGSLNSGDIVTYP